MSLRNRTRRPTFGKSFMGKMQEATETIKDLGDTLAEQMPETAKQAGYKPNRPAPEPTPEPEPEPEPVHKDLDSDYDYETPYGISDQHNYHAICVTTEGALKFLSSETENGLEESINNCPGLEDVIAVYGGNLLYFEERRIIKIRH